MAKAKLTSVTKDWIDGKTEKHNNIKELKCNNDTGKIRQTIYLSKETNKILWLNRIETGEPISRIIERLVMSHLNKELKISNAR